LADKLQARDQVKTLLKASNSQQPCQPKRQQSALSPVLLVPVARPRSEVGGGRAINLDRKQEPACDWLFNQEGTTMSDTKSVDWDEVEAREERGWQIEKLQQRIENLLATRERLQAKARKFRQERPEVVSPEAFSPEEQRLQVVSQVGNPADLPEIIADLYRQALSLGGDKVCEMTIVAVGGESQQVLVTGLAVKTVELLAAEDQQRAKETFIERQLTDLREELEELSEQ
jgi:cell division protein FtsB